MKLIFYIFCPLPYPKIVPAPLRGLILSTQQTNSKFFKKKQNIARNIIMGVGSGRQGGRGPPGFSYMVFFGLFCYFSVFLLFSVFFSLAFPWKRLNSAIFRSFLLFFGLLFRCPFPLKIFLPTP